LSQNQELKKHVNSHLEWLISVIYEMNYSPEIEKLYSSFQIMDTVEAHLNSGKEKYDQLNDGIIHQTFYSHS